MKILHMSDQHSREKDIDQVMKSCKAILAMAEIERPDLIVSAGDMFDSRDIRLDTETVKFIFQWISDLARIAPVAIVSGTPTHDGNTIEALRQIPGVLVSTMPEQLYFADGKISYQPTEKTTAIISMVPTPTKQFFQGNDDEIADAMTGLFAGFGAQASEFECPHILVGHFAVKGAAISDTQVMIGREIEIGRDQIDLARADVVCLGHIHKSQKIGTNIFYAGSIYSLNFGETEAKGFYVHEIHGKDKIIKDMVDSRFITLPTKKMINIKEDHTDPENFFANYKGPEDVKGADVKVIIKAYQDDAAGFDKAAIEAIYLKDGAESVTIQIINVPRETVRSERLLTLSTLRDKVQEMATLNGESIVASILQKADLLETQSPEEILKYVTNDPYAASDDVSATGQDLLDVPELHLQAA
jgi:DNA repair protein SbcD/Mre11